MFGHLCFWGGVLWGFCCLVWFLWSCSKFLYVCHTRFRLFIHSRLHVVNYPQCISGSGFRFPRVRSSALLYNLLVSPWFLSFFSLMIGSHTTGSWQNCCKVRSENTTARHCLKRNLCTSIYFQPTLSSVTIMLVIHQPHWRKHTSILCCDSPDSYYGLLPCSLAVKGLCWVIHQLDNWCHVATMTKTAQSRLGNSGKKY